MTNFFANVMLLNDYKYIVVTTSKGFLISEEYGTVRIYQRVVEEEGEGDVVGGGGGHRYEERRLITPFGTGTPAPMRNMALAPAGI